jgi:hypothetical protein
MNKIKSNMFNVTVDNFESQEHFQEYKDYMTKRIKDEMLEVVLKYSKFGNIEIKDDDRTILRTLKQQLE